MHTLESVQAVRYSSTIQVVPVNAAGFFSNASQFLQPLHSSSACCFLCGQTSGVGPTMSASLNLPDGDESRHISRVYLGTCCRLQPVVQQLYANCTLLARKGKAQTGRKLCFRCFITPDAESHKPPGKLEQDPGTRWSIHCRGRQCGGCGQGTGAGCIEYARRPGCAGKGALLHHAVDRGAARAEG